MLLFEYALVSLFSQEVNVVIVFSSWYDLLWLFGSWNLPSFSVCGGGCCSQGNHAGGLFISIPGNRDAQGFVEYVFAFLPEQLMSYVGY